LAISFFSQYIHPEIFDYHADIIPLLLNYIHDLEELIVFKALFALNIFAENMEEKISDYVEIIVPKLIKFLEEK